MTKRKITIAEAQKLNEEMTDLLKEKLPVYVKFWMHSLKKKMKPELDSLSIVQKSIFEKYGKEENGVLRVNPNEDYFSNFTEEMNSVLNQTIEIEHFEFNVSMFQNVETDINLDVFFTLMS